MDWYDAASECPAAPSDVTLQSIGYRIGSGVRIRWLFRDVCLRLSKGDTLGVVGASGVGKTALAYLLAGLTRPTLGELVIDGEKVARGPTNWQRTSCRPYSQMVFQNPYDSFSPVLSLIDYVRRLAPTDESNRTEFLERFFDLCAMFELPSALLERKSVELSGGQCQRASAAFALACKPSLLLLDEPTSMLDRRAAALVEAAIGAGIHGGNRVVVVFSHDFRLLARICSRVAVMDGRGLVEVNPAVLRSASVPGTVGAEQFQSWNVLEGGLLPQS